MNDWINKGGNVKTVVSKIIERRYIVPFPKLMPIRYL